MRRWLRYEVYARTNRNKVGWVRLYKRRRLSDAMSSARALLRVGRSGVTVVCGGHVWAFYADGVVVESVSVASIDRRGGLW